MVVGLPSLTRPLTGDLRLRWLCEAGDDEVVVLRVHSLLGVAPHRVAMGAVPAGRHSGEREAVQG